MDRISGLNQIIEVLRKNIGKSRSGTTERSKTKTSDSHVETNSTSQLSIEELEIRIIERVKSVDIDEKSGKTKAYIFIESVLAWEFGEDILNDPGFHDLVSRVAESIQSVEHVDKKLNQLFLDMEKQSKD